MTQSEKIPRLREEKRKKNTNRPLLFLLILFFVILLLILFFRSSMSKLQDINVTGNQYVSTAQIIKDSGLTFSMQFLLIDKDKVAQSLLAAIPAIEQVNVEKNFPGKIKLMIKERPRVALMMENQGALYPVTDAGIELKDHPVNENAVDKPIIRNWSNPQLLPTLANELTKMDPAVSQLISEISLMPQKNDTERLVLFMKDGYEVHTTLSNFAQYMSLYPSFVRSLKQEGKTEGIINLSEVKWYEPYPEQPNPQQTNGDQTKSP